MIVITHTVLDGTTLKDMNDQDQSLILRCNDDHQACQKTKNIIIELCSKRSFQIFECQARALLTIQYFMVTGALGLLRTQTIIGQVIYMYSNWRNQHWLKSYQEQKRNQDWSRDTLKKKLTGVVRTLFSILTLLWTMLIALQRGRCLSGSIAGLDKLLGTDNSKKK